jgi:CYTH domain-containing protein
MPIENERKLLLKTSKSQELINSLISDPDAEWSDIVQAYLNNSCRIRHVVPHHTSHERFVFTFKTKVRGATVEIEQDLDVHDYQKLFLIGKPIVVKTRATIRMTDYTWDIDFLRRAKSGEIYAVVAEAEMPEFSVGLPPIHPKLEPYAIRWIDREDKRFNNRNLANINKVKKLLKEFDAKL